ncbi:MAG: serine hydrolase domain-containing protein [Promethearchaeota archaeon]|jgi:CubicO group peptidase (beta-lactamase class C family)
MNKNKKVMLGIFLVAIVASSSIGIIVVINNSQSEDTFYSKIQQLMNNGNIPSLAAGIIINDSLVWSKGFGEQSDLDTVYMIGSTTKMFTATTIMQLYENNSLDLDVDINTYMPFSVRNPIFPSHPISIRMLLTHTSGLSHADKTLWDYDTEMLNWSNHNLGTNFTKWNPYPTLGEFLNGSLNPAGLYYESENWENFEPGDEWQYSNLGFLLLAYIVEQLTNRSYVDYLYENVLTPLDMTSTGFDYTNFTGRNAIPYEQRDNKNFAYPIYNQYDIGGGALRSTVPDLTKFLIAHMNQGSYNNTQILLPQTVDLMQTSQYTMSGHNWGDFTFIGHGLGWPLYTENTIGHSGAIPGYITNMAFKRVDAGGYGIVFMLNKGSSLVQDTYLIDTFFPSLIEVLFSEAARLFHM